MKLKKNLKRLKKKTRADTWHVLFKNVNYLNAVSQKDQIDKFDENENLIEHKTKMRTKLNKNNKNREMYI